MAKVKKIESYYELDSEMSGMGMGNLLSQAEDLEFEANRRRGQRTRREPIQERLVQWFNDADSRTECDITRQRPSYCMVIAMKKKYIERSKARGR